MNTSPFNSFGNFGRHHQVKHQCANNRNQGNQSGPIAYPGGSILNEEGHGPLQGFSNHGQNFGFNNGTITSNPGNPSGPVEYPGGSILNLEGRGPLQGFNNI